MNQIFKHSRSLWVKYSDYVINEAPNGKKYLQAAPKAVPQPCIWRVKYGEKLLIIWYNSNAMILYVDETENNEFFIVTGLLMSSRETTERVYRSFKKKARNMPVAKRDKAALFTEFKSTMLDRHYQRIKFKMIESLAETDKQIIYSCYVKKDGVFPQNFKEDTYIALLSRIVLHVEEDISIIFDAFNKSDF